MYFKYENEEAGTGECSITVEFSDYSWVGWYTIRICWTIHEGALENFNTWNKFTTCVQDSWCFVTCKILKTFLATSCLSFQTVLFCSFNHFNTFTPLCDIVYILQVQHFSLYTVLMVYTIFNLYNEINKNSGCSCAPSGKFYANRIR